MFEKIKYILFDFSDNFKHDFLNTLKKSAAFFIIGIIAVTLKNSIEFAGFLGSLCIFIFGFMWGRSLINSLAILSTVSNNFMIRLTLTIVLYAIGIIFGYIYFLWCLIKMLIILIKKQIQK